MTNNKFTEEYYHWLLAKIVCTCDNCWSYKLTAECCFPDKKYEIDGHWNDL